MKDTLREKIIAAGPLAMIEVTAQELSRILAGEMNDAMEQGRKLHESKEHGLAAMAGEPDHAAHLDRVNTQESEVTFEEAVKPLIKWMAENSCSHSHVVVSGVSAELFHGQKSFNTFEFVQD